MGPVAKTLFLVSAIETPKLSPVDYGHLRVTERAVHSLFSSFSKLGRVWNPSNQFEFTAFMAQKIASRFRVKFLRVRHRA